jgi:hypothetical protein
MAKTAKPAAKTKKGPKEAPVDSGLVQSFSQLLHNPEQVFQLFDMFPFPIEVFAADGTTVFLNRALLKTTGASDADVGVYSILNDPVMERMGMKDGIRRTFFHGEPYSCYDIDIPVQDL